MWSSHEKSCRPNSLNIPSSHFVQQVQQQQQTQSVSTPNHIKLVKRDDLNEMIKQIQQTDKKQTGLVAQSQQQQQSIMRFSPQGNTLSIPSAVTPSNSLEDQKCLNLFLQAAGSALLTPNSAFANKTIDNFLNQTENNNSGGTNTKLQSPQSTQAQLLELGNGGNSSTLQRPNNLSLRGSSQAGTPTGMGNSSNPASFTSAFVQVRFLNLFLLF